MIIKSEFLVTSITGNATNASAVHADAQLLQEHEDEILKPYESGYQGCFFNGLWFYSGWGKLQGEIFSMTNAPTAGSLVYETEIDCAAYVTAFYP